MLRLNIQLFGGRSSGSGMSSSTSSGSNRGPGLLSKANTQSVEEAFGGKSANQVADDFFDSYRMRPEYKYDFVEGVANGKAVSSSSAYSEAIRTQGADHNPDLSNNGSWHAVRTDTGRDIREDYSGYLKSGAETIDGHIVLMQRLTPEASRQLKNALQSGAKRWLDKHPKPSHPRKDGYKWDGTKYVKSN